MEQISLAVSKRETTGKGAARKMRADGLIPAVVYGAGKSARNLAVADGDLQKVLRQISGSVAFLALKVGEEKPLNALLQELQTDYLGRKVLHVDFYEMDEKQELSVTAQLNFSGTPVGIDQGGEFNALIYEVTLKGKIADIPDSVDIDVSSLELNDAIMLSQVELPEGVTAVFEDDYPVANVALPKRIEEPEEEEEGEEGEEAEGEEAASEDSE
jgi:large subunit ribosomal protein L25